MSEFEKYDNALKVYKKELEEIAQKIKNVKEEMRPIQDMYNETSIKQTEAEIKAETDLDNVLLDKLGIEIETDRTLLDKKEINHTLLSKIEEEDEEEDETDRALLNKIGIKEEDEETDRVLLNKIGIEEEESEAKTEESEAKTEESEAKTEESEVKSEETESKTEESEAKTEESEAKTEETESKTEEKIKPIKKRDEIKNDFIVEIGQLRLKISRANEALNVERNKHSMKEEILGGQVDDSSIKKIVNEIENLNAELSEKCRNFEEYKLCQDKLIDEYSDKITNGYKQLQLLYDLQKKLGDKISTLNRIISDTLVDDYHKYAEKNGIEITKSEKLFAICNKFHQEKLLKDYVFRVKCTGKNNDEFCEWRRYGNERYCKCGSTQFYWCNKLKNPSETGNFNIHSTEPYGDVLTLNEINRNRRDFIQCGKYEKYPVWSL